MHICIPSLRYTHSHTFTHTHTHTHMHTHTHKQTCMHTHAYTCAHTHTHTHTCTHTHKHTHSLQTYQFVSRFDFNTAIGWIKSLEAKNTARMVTHIFDTAVKNLCLTNDILHTQV